MTAATNTLFSFIDATRAGYHARYPQSTAAWNPSSAKLWLTPVSVAASVGMSARDLAEAVRIARRNRKRLLEAWHGYFGTQGG